MTLDRRKVLLTGASTLAALASGRTALAEGTLVATKDAAENDATRSIAPPRPTPQFEEALRNVLGDRVPVNERLRVDIPDLVENGNIVPYTLAADSPMTEDDHITRMYLLSTQNPNALVAVFRFTKHSGKAAVTGRMRLAKSQEVVAIAETSNGTALRGTCNVEVKFGGCGVD